MRPVKKESIIVDVLDIEFFMLIFSIDFFLYGLEKCLIVWIRKVSYALSYLIKNFIS